MAREKSYYEILGVEKNASQDDIKKKYRFLALKLHPDRMVGKSDSEKKDAEKKFQEISNAYKVLSDENTRRKYDSETEGFTGFRSAAGGFGESFEDIFESFFSGGSGRNKSSSKKDNVSQKGEDILYSISISFKEFILGAKKEFTSNFLKACPKCAQTGANSEADIKTCSTCNGRGEVDVIRRSLFGNIETRSTCSSCKGKGKIISKKCSVCKATNFISEKQNFELEIPKGLKPGERIVKRGVGNDGFLNSEKGDVYFEVNIQSHNYFSLKGSDIHVELPISFIDAILGSRVKLITVEGLEEIEIPSCSQFNDHLVIKNKGAYTGINSQARGNFYVWLQIRLPRKINIETARIFKNMQNNTEWNPNQDFIEKNRKILNEK